VPIICGTPDYWGAWNEPDNHRVPTGDPGKASGQGPEIAAKYWEIAQRRCASKGCTVLAGEFSGEGYYSLPAAPYVSIKAFIERYKNEIIAHHTYYRHNPKIFGLHDYGDPLHVKQSSRSAQYGAVIRPTLQLPKALGDPALKRPRVWVIETGVPLRLHGRPTPRLPGEPRASGRCGPSHPRRAKLPQPEGLLPGRGTPW